MTLWFVLSQQMPQEGLEVPYFRCVPVGTAGYRWVPGGREIISDLEPPILILSGLVDA